MTMKTFYFLVLAYTASISANPCTTNCCFGLTATGGQNGTIGQLDDGQARIGGPLSPAKFCITDTSIKDSQGRGCIVTGISHFTLHLAHLCFRFYETHAEAQNRTTDPMAMRLE